MQAQKNAFFILPPEADYPGIGPDIGAVAAMTAELDIVAMRCLIESG